MSRSNYAAAKTEMSEQRFLKNQCHCRLNVTWPVLALLAAHLALLMWSAAVQSPTLNEPGHLVGGLSVWEFGRFDVYKVNPPLVRMAAAVPAILVGYEISWENFYDGLAARPEFTLGEDLVEANGQKSFWLFVLGRWVCIPFSLMGAYFCYRWATQLYGRMAGVLALALWCFCPNIIAHGQLITSDTASAATGIAACYTFWRWLVRPSWWHTVFSGVVLGVAELTKTTLIVFFPMWPVIWLVYRWPDRRATPCREWLREAAMLAAQIVLSLYVVNLGYGFEGTLTRLGDFRFVSAKFGAESGKEKAPPEGGNRFAKTWIAGLPTPLPRNYLLGIDLQMRDLEDYRQPSYLRGEFRDKGWLYYYLYALAIKVPLGTLLLLALSAAVRFWIKVNIPWRDELVLLSPAVVILTFVSSQTGFSEHMRYVLPIFPFVFVWIGRIAVAFNRQHRIVAGVAGAALVWSIMSSLLVYPHNLSYFNELVGGPKGGPKHLIHSNVDWGQDLLFLKRWLEKHPEAKPLNLVYFGYFDPRHAGLEYKVPEQFLSSDEAPIPLSKIPPGWYAVSVNFVRGLPYFVYKGDGTKGSLRQYALTQFQKLKPVAMAGYSIYIYHVSEKSK